MFVQQLQFIFWTSIWKASFTNVFKTMQENMVLFAASLDKNHTEILNSAASFVI